ncbi:MAG TPA: TolC family protein [Bacteroidia bacterium]|nr:TolC family protein [Bacteroidia bacterium]HNU34763.1 TolC family protein [Bacteroidia bacterium]
MYKNLIKIYSFVILLIISKNAQAQQSESFSFSLQQAIEYALQHQATTKNAALDVEIAQKKINELIGVGLPNITGSADINKFIEIPTSFVPAEFFGGQPGEYAPVQFGQPYSSSVGLSASQLVFDGSYLVGLQASRTYAELSKKNLEQSKIETSANVSKAYYSVLVNRERHDLLVANVQRIKKLKDDTKAMYDNGFIEKIDNDRIVLTYNNIVVEEQKVKRFLTISENLLKFQMGMDLNANLELADKLATIKMDETLPGEEKADASRRIEYSIMQTNKRLQELDLKRTRFEYLPSLVAFGSVSANASRNEFDIFDTDKRWYPTAVIGAKLSVPIFDGLQKSARIGQSKLTLQKIDNGFKSLEQGINLEVQNSRTQLLNNIEVLKTQRENKDLATEVARVSKIKYDQGVGSNLEVINAETSLKEAETNYYSSLYDVLISKIDYAKATGSLK